MRLAELVPVAAQGLSTEIILPPYRQSLDLLDEGWEEATAVQAREQGLWIVGTAGSFRFFSAVGGPTLLEVEATALASPDMPQVMQLEVNGRTVHREAMPRQWKRYEFSLSAQDVRLGWNVVTMRFRHALRPRDLDSASGDVRLLAARFRRLRIRSSFGRTLWADGPSAIEVTPVAADRSDVSTILMPTDSALDFYLLSEHGALLTGSVDAVVADRSLGGASGLRWSLSRRLVASTSCSSMTTGLVVQNRSRSASIPGPVTRFSCVSGPGVERMGSSGGLA